LCGDCYYQYKQKWWIRNNEWWMIKEEKPTGFSKNKHL
jgi:hypothetical protein